SQTKLWLDGPGSPMELPRYLGDLSQALVSVLQAFDRLRKATVKSIEKSEPDRAALILQVVRKLDDLQIRLRMWMEDIILKESGQNITIFDALDIISERPEDVWENLMKAFKNMSRNLNELESISWGSSSEETKSVKYP
ncbi:hypothetical protein MGN70_014805, partial [Eutypa lata]